MTTFEISVSGFRKLAVTILEKMISKWNVNKIFFTTKTFLTRTFS